ncbi:DUF4334 domain-containing protein [Corynebacterium sp.]|uniref:DUF4334 domain-containing protein n=1 Tax=Corynebacterium sp. TaxID=1720 RepID=UPI0025BC68F2|nr:DUF4334 domain-containing protein [Corynebacterium sp.]
MAPPDRPTDATLDGALNGALKDALARFDALPAVTTGEMVGRWRGAEVATGHPLDGLLVPLGWHGKRFDGDEDGHPLVFRSGPALFAANPALVPVSAAAALRPLATAGPFAALVRLYLRATATTRPRARLRMVEYRGVSTATMIYDSLPVNDHFRRIDDRTLLGVMDFRHIRRPYVFTLQRED